MRMILENDEKFILKVLFEEFEFKKCQSVKLYKDDF